MFVTLLMSQWSAPNASERIGCYPTEVNMKEPDKDKDPDNGWIRGGINE